MKQAGLLGYNKTHLHPPSASLVRGLSAILQRMHASGASKKVLLCWILFTGTLAASYATHNRAGEITFRQKSGYTYEVTITTFTYRFSAANRSSLTIEWGDNSSSVASLVRRDQLGADYYHNTYITTHTFPGPGIYTILMQDPNRNFGVLNIPNSVNVVFSIETTLVISPEIGTNNTPVLLNFPVDRAARGHVFIHNPAAFDPDGDSISYKLTVCKGQDGRPIADYSLPPATDTLFVDPVVGDLVWDTPRDTGTYNVAINIEEWRFGVKIGNIVRDMQIDVYETDNNPPVNPPLTDFCVTAGDTVTFLVTITDADNDLVRDTMTGGPFVVDSQRASYSTLSSVPGTTVSRFTWITNCSHIRKQPYTVILRSEDENDDIPLVDLDNFNIRVLAPAPENPGSTATSSEIDLTWSAGTCGNISGYNIYRHDGNAEFTADSCQNGVPASTAFRLVGSVSGKANTAFTDDNNGEGLVQGIQYCYLITAVYPDGSESYASVVICNSLVPGFPSLLNTSVTEVDEFNGQIFLSWAKPRNFDPLTAPGPYVYRIFRSAVPDPGSFVLIDTLATADLNDTTYLDEPLNTLLFPYYYNIKLFNNTPGNRFEMRPGESEIASSLYLEPEPDDNQVTLNIRKKTPWINQQYVIYRRSSGFTFDSVGVSATNLYVDTGLKNGVTYCYQVKSYGWRPIDGVVFNNSNLSHIACATPEDISAPCRPLLTVVSSCDSLFNRLVWTNPNSTCANDVVRYNIYYSPQGTGELDSLTAVSPAEDTTYTHLFSPGMMLSGCYAVTAIDSFENESDFSALICVDECIMYSLPNVFSPNGDNSFDTFVSDNLNGVVERVDMKIFNRFGVLVYETNDPAINWDGRYKNTNNEVPSGVYYYVCDVFEPRLGGVQVRTLVGFIHVYQEGNAGEVTK